MFLNFQGKFEEAEALFRSALVAAKENARLFPQREYAHLLVEGIRAELGENLARQGRLIEAEIEVRKALTDVLGRLGRNSIETAQILRRVITIIGEQGRHGEAEMLARALTDIYVSIGSPADAWSLALSRRLLAETLVNQGRWQEALAEFDAIKLGLASDADVFDQAFAENLDWALALAGANRADEALAMAKSAVERVRRTVGDKHYNTAEASGVLAKALAGLDKREEALGEFRKALPILLSRSRQADDENTTKAVRAQRLGLILEAYIGLLADVRGTKLESASGIDATAESFRLANVARGRSVQSALAASAVRSAARTPELADLLRREQDARKQIGALFGLLANALSVPTDEQNAGVIKDLRVRVDLLRTARATLAEEIAARFPDYFELINPKPATIEQARLALRPGEALITTYVGADRTYVWAVPKTGDVAFTAVDLGLESLTEAVVELRSALDPDAESLGDIPQFDLATAHRLYRALLEPVRVGWKDSKSLLVIAHGPLGYLPLSLLPTKAVTVADAASLFSGYRDVPWLVRDHAVTVLPSVVSLRTLRALPVRPGVRKAFVGFGDPYFSKEQEVAAAKPKAKQTAVLASRGLKTRGLPVRLRAAPKTQGINSAQLAMLPRLPDTADEVQGMAAALKADPATSVFLGKAAGETAVKAMDLSAVKVIAFATHGLVPGDLNGLTQPALALSSPAVAGGGDDGLLTMGEILGLRLNADWVVLSACDTGSGEGAGAEAVSGLGRAFFYAGTRALLVSNWPVETTSARILTTRLFAAQAADPGLERTQALRRTMLALIDGPGPKDDQGKVLFSYAHPIFWAPFSLVGDGGGRKPAS